MNVVPIRPKAIDLSDVSSFTSEQIDEALCVIMDSDYKPKNAELEAFRYDSNLARDLMSFVERQSQD